MKKEKTSKRKKLEAEAEAYSISNSETATDEELEASVKQMRKLESEHKLTKGQIVMPGIELVATANGTEAITQGPESQEDSPAAGKKDTVALDELLSPEESLEVLPREAQHEMQEAGSNGEIAAEKKDDVALDEPPSQEPAEAQHGMLAACSSEELAAEKKVSLAEKLAGVINNISVAALQRFPLTALFLVVLSIVNITFIIIEDFNGNLEASLGLGALSALLFEMSKEHGITKSSKLYTVPLILTALDFAVLNIFDNIYVEIATGGICVALTALIFYVLHEARETGPFSHLIKASFICGVFTSIVYSGIATCIVAFNFLIFKFPDVWKILGIFGVIINLLFYGLLFISFIPKKEDAITIPKVYRTIIHKALFYIYLLLIAILYLYIFKVILIHKMPVGKFNWFGCFALLFFVIFHLSVEDEDGILQQKYRRFGAIMMIPVLIMQFIGIYIRISSYGLTAPRFMSMILVLIAILFMIQSLFKLPVKYPFIGVAIISLLFTCTPFNIIDIPNRNQEAILKNTLSEAGAYTNNVLDDTVKIDKKYMRKISSAYDYLKDSQGTKSKFYKEFEKSQIAKNVDGQEYAGNIRHIDYNSDWMTKGADISKYKNIKSLYGNTEKVEGVDLTDFFLNIGEDYKGTLKYSLKNKDIYFDYIYFDYNEDEEVFAYISWSGYLLEK